MSRICDLSMHTIVRYEVNGDALRLFLLNSKDEKIHIDHIRLKEPGKWATEDIILTAPTAQLQNFIINDALKDE